MKVIVKLRNAYTILVRNPELFRGEKCKWDKNMLKMIVSLK
jgi:hypothetical protein